MTRAPARTVPDLTGLLTHAAHVLTTQLTAALEEIDVTPRGYCVLFHALQEERTQSQLAELGDMDKTTMVVTMDALERAGLAERRPSSTDRRARIVKVTPAGARKAAQGAEIVDRVHRAVLDALPGGDRDSFVRSLEHLVSGFLAVPAESGRQVRRSRESPR